MKDGITAAAPATPSASAQRASVRSTPTKDPETARKLFEQNIATHALSEAKKNPKSTAKGNGLILTVGAYPSVLPADGKSTAFIVAKVTDAKGSPLAKRRVRFTASAGTVLIPSTVTDERGIALSRFCAAALPKGTKHIAVVKAHCNPAAQVEIVMDGDGSFSITGGFPAPDHFCVLWYKNAITCTRQGAEPVGGSAQVEMHIVQPLSGNFYPYFWINFVKVLGDGHYGQVGLAHPGHPQSPPHLYHAPTPRYGQEVVFSFGIGATSLGWSRFHHGPVRVVINYTFAQYRPPGVPPLMLTQEVELTAEAKNATVEVLAESAPVLAWDPEDGAASEQAAGRVSGA